MLFTYWDTGPFPDDGIVAAWSAEFSDFTVFSRDDVTELVQQRIPGSLDLWNRIAIPACRSDLARVLLLAEYGGLYVDAHCTVGDPLSLRRLLSILESVELVAIDRVNLHKRPGDVHLVNGALAAQAHSALIEDLLACLLNNLHEQFDRESQTDDYVPYNLAVVTGAWNLRLLLCEVGDDNEVRLNNALHGRAHLLRLPDPAFGTPFNFHANYGYRKPGMHWSERQLTERLFEPE
ncbi:MAG: hypothetical protein F2842_09100 [Actinobacteria bacterium]|uniref:Unannotated protein n=1 Tax=freshwater metagenome TaxID=449393 RepID=A0A6J7KQR9_9ZZZZ|nr:hypothetical protein [Actinomycetota bacterium]